jgi:hypothetical protein
MEWIKAKYDRVLLGLCGLIALIIGAILLMKVLGWKKSVATPQSSLEERNDFGTNDASTRVTAALTRLQEVAEVKAPLKDGIPISLFSSAPVIKMAGQTEAQRVVGGNPIRPPVDNRWLYDNNLDLRQVNILEVDTDGDKFTNLEEYTADPKTNPRDAASHPPVYAKIQYKEVIQEPLSVKFNTYVNDKELTMRVIGATPESAFNTKDLVVGGSFAVERNGTEMRFKLTRVDATIEGREKAYLEDLKTGAKDIEVSIREEKKFPTNKAKLVCTLGMEEEKIVTKGEEFSFQVDPDQTYKVLEVTETEVALEHTPKGASEAKTIKISIVPPP